jgi:hypothetical protein
VDFTAETAESAEEKSKLEISACSAYSAVKPVAQDEKVRMAIAACSADQS